MSVVDIASERSVGGGTDESYLEVARESTHKEAGLDAENSFVSIVLAGLAVTDLLECDVGKRGVIEEPGKWR
jgi:hypothetical protein